MVLPTRGADAVAVPRSVRAIQSEALLCVGVDSEVNEEWADVAYSWSLRQDLDVAAGVFSTSGRSSSFFWRPMRRTPLLLERLPRGCGSLWKGTLLAALSLSKKRDSADQLRTWESRCRIHLRSLRLFFRFFDTFLHQISRVGDIRSGSGLRIYELSSGGINAPPAALLSDSYHFPPASALLADPVDSAGACNQFIDQLEALGLGVATEITFEHQR